MDAEPSLKVYAWQSDEYLLIDWYAQLVASGDMAVTFTPDMRYMSNFLGYFRGRVTLGYATDARGIWFAYWIEPFLSGAFVGIWIRKEQRATSRALRHVIYGYNEAFKVATVLISLCKQEHLRELIVKLGYQTATTIPALWNGADVDVHIITRDMWEQRYGRRKK